MKRTVAAASLILAFCNKTQTAAPAPSPSTAALAASASTVAVASASASSSANASGVETSRFYVASGDAFKTTFDFAIERRGSDALAMLTSESGGRVVALRGHATGEADAFRFTVDAAEQRAGRHGLHIEGRVSGAVIRELEVREPDRKAPIPTTLAPSRALDFDQTYAGSLGAHAHIRMKLARKGDAVSGVYRYTQSTDDLRVLGRVTSASTFELDESSGSRVTGHFAGALVGRTGVLARWTSPDGARTFAVALASGAHYPEIVALQSNRGRVVPRERYTKAAPFCEDDRIVPAFDGLADASGQRALDVALAPQAMLFDPVLTKSDCEGSSEAVPFSRMQSYAIDGEKSGFVAFTSSIEEFTGGAHGLSASRCFVADLGKHTVVRLAPELGPTGRAKVRALAIKALEVANKVTKLTDAGFFDDAPDLGDADVCFAIDAGTPKLRVDFPLYAIAPYVMGAPSVALDTKDVAGVFPAGTTGSMLFP